MYTFYPVYILTFSSHSATINVMQISDIVAFVCINVYKYPKKKTQTYLKGEIFVKKKSFALLAVLLIMSLMLAACGGGGTATNGDTELTGDYIFASGGTSGTYYPYCGAVAQAWMDQFNGLTVTVQATGASAENLNLINKGEADIAIVQNDTMTYAYEGTEGFSNADPIKNFSVMATVYPEVVQIIARADSGITSVADLAGKTVSVGDLGSGVEANAKQILGAVGLTFDDLKAQHLGFGASADAMKDGKCDAAFITAGIPTTAVMEYANTNDMVLVPIDQETIDKLTEQYAYYTEYTSPADTYKNAEDVNTVAVKATLVVRSDMDDDTVYTLTKALFDNQEVIASAHAKGAELNLETAVEGVSTPLHPGAEKYYKEVGILK